MAPAGPTRCCWCSGKSRSGGRGSNSALPRKVPADSFRPKPSVDGGLITIGRRADPLVDAGDRGRYQAMVHQVFTAGDAASRRSSAIHAVTSSSDAKIAQICANS